MKLEWLNNGLIGAQDAGTVRDGTAQELGQAILVLKEDFTGQRTLLSANVESMDWARGQLINAAQQVRTLENRLEETKLLNGGERESIRR